MPSSSLTPGAIRTMVDSFEGSKVEGYHPTLQVINIKPVQNGNDRFRVRAVGYKECTSVVVVVVVV